MEQSYWILCVEVILACSITSLITELDSTKMSNL